MRRDLDRLQDVLEAIDRIQQHTSQSRPAFDASPLVQVWVVDAMQPAKSSATDRATEVVPEIRHAVPWRVVSVEALDGSRLRVRFVDGTVGEVRIQAFLTSPAVGGTVFEPLRHPAEFARVGIQLGAVSWPSGADLAPDAMYDAIRAHGAWTLE